MRARSSRAPAPRRRGKRAPAILAARFVSRIPSAAPSASCAFASKPKAGFSPHVRMTGFSAGEAPSGVVSWGRFGRRRRASRCSSSSAASSASKVFASAVSRWFSARRASASPPGVPLPLELSDPLALLADGRGAALDLAGVPAAPAVHLEDGSEVEALPPPGQQPAHRFGVASNQPDIEHGRQSPLAGRWGGGGRAGDSGTGNVRTIKRPE